MNAGTDRYLSIVLLILFLGFLTFVSMKEGLDFDASYNMLSYQSLFNGQGFNYTYNGRNIPFDPVISTGPEFYLPVFLIWKMIGEVNYFSAIHVLIVFYAAFLSFLLFYILDKSNYKTLCLLIFLCLFFGDSALFRENVFINPKGEPVAAFLMCAGCYLVCQKRMNIAGFFLFGLAVDIKTNIVVALVPSMGIFIVLEYLWPNLKEKKYKETAKNLVKFFLISLLIITPNLIYTKIAPAIALNNEEKQVLEEAQQARSGYMVSRGFGHLIQLFGGEENNGISGYYKKLKEKILVFKSFFADSFIITIIFLFSLPFFIWFSFVKKSYSLYLFLISFFISGWWLFAAGDAWYRYFSVAEYIYFFALVSLLPVTADSGQKPVVFIYAMVILAISLPRFSWQPIHRHFDDTDRKTFFAMQDEIKDIDENRIFTYGWFQAPQLMFLTGKRFQDFFDLERLQQAKEKFGKVFFLTTIENTMIRKDMEKLVPHLDLVSAHGYNKLYTFRDAVNVSNIKITNFGPSKIISGKPFNAQANGKSAMWIVAENISPSCVIVWGDTILKTEIYMERSVLTAFVPAHLYQGEGQYKIFIQDVITNEKSPAVIINAASE